MKGEEKFYVVNLMSAVYYTTIALVSSMPNARSRNQNRSKLMNTYIFSTAFTKPQNHVRITTEP